MENEAGGNVTAAERVRRMVEEVIDGTPLFVVDVDVRGRPGSQAVDIFVESDEDLDVATIARVSREVQFLLDTEEVLSGKYHLTVSSPGLDRPLVLPRQYKKNVNRLLRVHYKKADESGNAELTGKLKAVGDDGIEVEADGRVESIAFDRIVWAKVQLPW